MRRLRLAGRAPLLLRPPDMRQLLPGTVVDLSGVTFVTPLDLVGLASLLWQARAFPNIRIEPPRLPTVANYLLRMDLPDAFGPRLEVQPPFDREWPRDYSPALIELTRIATATEVHAIANRLHRRLRRHLPARTCAQVAEVIGELAENATTHGSSPAGAFLAGQYYSGESSGMPEGFWVGVADAGIGVRSHLARNPEYRGLSDIDSVRTAVLPGVTGTADASRGHGLTSVRRLTGRRAPGRLVIRSGHGEAWYFVDPHGTRTARYRRHGRSVAGTWVLALTGSRGRR